MHRTLQEAGIRQLAGNEALIGSGGSVRLLSRLDRWREPYPIIKIHGYQVDAESLAEQTRQLATRSCVERLAMEGMNPDRGHTIVGGAIIAHALAQYAHADGMVVSGQGLREGLARHPHLSLNTDSVAAPPLESIRAASLVDLVNRFVPRFSRRGRRRAALAAGIGEAVWEPDGREIREPLQCAAFLLDIGNAIDFYNRLNRTASIIVRTDLPGFTHRESTLVAGILLAAERKKLPRRFRRSKLLQTNDHELIRQAAAALLLSEELENRLPIGCNPDVVRFERQNGMLSVTTPAWSARSWPGAPRKVDCCLRRGYQHREVRIMTTLQAHLAYKMGERYGKHPDDGHYPGKLIIVEGIDGSGKSTQIDLLQKWLNSRNLVTVFTEWNSSPIVRRTTKRGKTEELLTPMSFSLIHAADFANRVHAQILPALRAGAIVLADRYVFTAFARDSARGVDRDWLRRIYSFAVQPTLGLYFQGPAGRFHTTDQRRARGIGILRIRSGHGLLE